jgi:hypothetical protein
MTKHNLLLFAMWTASVCGRWEKVRGMSTNAKKKKKKPVKILFKTRKRTKIISYVYPDKEIDLARNHSVQYTGSLAREPASPARLCKKKKTYTCKSPHR